MTATRIFIVTPSFNAGETIDQTIMSVLNQAGPFELHYHVQDGGSTDDTAMRLQRWADRLADGEFPTPCNKVHFSFESTDDNGMYDAIARGFASFERTPEDWLTWINADDMLAPGACALMAMIDDDDNGSSINWISGAATIINDGAVISQVDRRMASEVVRLGLCDGQHWEYVQQEGTFFRQALWLSIDPDADFSRFRLAGDWNLWRRFAETAELHQVAHALGLFHVREGQLSQSQQDDYLQEINSVLSTEERTKALISLMNKPLSQKRLSIKFTTREIDKSERDLTNHLKHRLNMRFGEKQAKTMQAKKTNAALQEEANDYQISEDTPDTSELAGQRTQVIAHNEEWQFPARTEHHAFIKARKFLPYVEGVCYFAFPWATLIDQVNAKFDRGSTLKNTLNDLSVENQKYERVVTVCQHIHMHQFADIFTGAGVTDVFWVHATIGQSEITSADGRTLRIHAFPLYPVQAIDIDRNCLEEDRRYLFSFIGAKSNEWYLTQSRDWILDQLTQHPRGFVVGRDSWHYQKIVYDLQISQTAKKTTDLIDDNASKIFRELLLDSVFSLCPSGTGPNSIRLWESIGAGAIPVILADTYQVPGNQELWNNAVVFCPETPEDIAALPSRLEAIAADPELIASMRKHLTQLWMLYGPETFISDIQRYYIEAAGDHHAKSHAGAPLTALANQINSGELPAIGGLDTFLELCAGRFMVDEKEFAETVREDRTLRSACEFALLNCQHRELVAQISTAWIAAGLELPDENSPQHTNPISVRRPQIHLFGKHLNRTPMYYKPYRKLFEQHADYVDDIWKADMVVTGFDTDFRSATADLSKVTKMRPEIQFLTVSEEPLWDTVWSAVLTQNSGIAGNGASAIPYGVANHVNSKVFAFDRLPYFITTDDKFFQRYARLFQRNAEMSVEELLTVWRAASIRAAFYAEHRLDKQFDLFHTELHLRGLCSLRTRIAEAVQHGPIVRVGQGWNPDAVRRQSLPDWHLDKLAALDRKTLIVSGLENTHHPEYITEKIFDAFAVLGVPLYYAEPCHRIHELCPAGGFLNLYGHSEEAAAALIDAFEPDAAFAQAYLDTQKALANLFSEPETLNRERDRVVSAVLRLL